MAAASREDPEYTAYKRDWSKRYMGRVREVVRTVKMIQSEISELEAGLDGVGAAGFSARRGSQAATDGRMVELMARRDMLLAKFYDELDRNLQAQADAHAALAHLDQPLRAVLTYRYMLRMDWRSVAKELDYDVAYCKQGLHDKALVELFPYIPHEYDDLPEAI